MDPATQPPDNPERPREQRHPLSRPVRITIYASVVVAGVLGFMIAYSVFDIACARSGCGVIVPVLWGLGGAILAVVGSAVVAVLLSRSFAEWNMGRGAEVRDDPPDPSTC